MKKYAGYPSSVFPLSDGKGPAGASAWGDRPEPQASPQPPAWARREDQRTKGGGDDVTAIGGPDAGGVRRGDMPERWDCEAEVVIVGAGATGGEFGDARRS